MKRIFARLREERGAVQVIEMTLILPIVFFIMGFLLYTGNYIMQSVVMYNDAQVIAVAAGRAIGFPGYSQFMGYREGGSSNPSNVTVNVDFPSNSNLSSVVKTVMQLRAPYRYWQSGNNLIKSSERIYLENYLQAMIAKTSFLGGGKVDCVITPVQNVVTQKVRVEVSKKVEMPGLLRMLPVRNFMEIKVTATAVASDPAEMIRNTEMVLDYADEFLTETKTGQQILDNITGYVTKLKSVLTKFGIG